MEITVERQASGQNDFKRRNTEAEIDASCSFLDECSVFPIW